MFRRRSRFPAAEHLGRWLCGALGSISPSTPAAFTPVRGCAAHEYERHITRPPERRYAEVRIMLSACGGARLTARCLPDLLRIIRALRRAAATRWTAPASAGVAERALGPRRAKFVRDRLPRRDQPLAHARVCTDDAGSLANAGSAAPSHPTKHAGWGARGPHPLRTAPASDQALSHRFADAGQLPGSSG
ncbi:MAG: hypothetical protein H6Q85_1279 [candidate division NC10 bacterium]|nr:hypothetical protein [candidate division NC10 bacterium]